jgi:hypothetical protein
MRGEWREFQERRAGIEQRADAIARQQLVALEMLLPRFLTAAQRDLCQSCAEILDNGQQGVAILAELRRARIDLRGQYGHKWRA